MALSASVGVGAAAICSGAVAAYCCECCDSLRWKHHDGNTLPSISKDAPVVRCFSKLLGKQPRNLLLSLSDDMLLVGRRPGPADERFFLSGAQITVKADVVTIEPRNTDSLTLWLDSAEEAELWSTELRVASRIVEQNVQAPAVQSVTGEYQDRVKTARIAELEARVNATLSAAVQRAHRIQELEVLVEQGKERAQRIKELELIVEQTTREANSRAERIKELENIISSHGAIKDAVATGILEDAMRFADEMLGNREEEMMIDGGSAAKIKESMGKVQNGDKLVDRDVAELISNLVAALRWPLVLRKRLANAENNVKEQKDIHDATVQQLHSLQKGNVLGQSDVRALQQQQTNSQFAHQQAQEETTKLKKLLTKAEHDRDAAIEQQKTAMNVSQLEELRAVQHLAATAQAESSEAQAQANDLRHHLALAEQKMAASESRVASVEKQSAQAQGQANELREHLAAAEEMQVQAAKMKARLEVAEASYQEASTRQKELLEAGHAKMGTKGPGSPEKQLELEQARTAELEKKLAAAVLASNMALGQPRHPSSTQVQGPPTSFQPGAAGPARPWPTHVPQGVPTQFMPPRYHQ